MAGLKAQGTQFFNVAGATRTQVKGLRNFDGPGGESAEIDATDLDSDAREYEAGLPDFGEFSFEMNERPTDPGQALLYANQQSRATLQWELVLPNGAVTYAFDGFVKQIRPSGEVDGILQSAGAIRVTGFPERTVGTP